MTPPRVPGYPSAELPTPWAKDLAELRRRVEILERDASTHRAQLQSYTDEEEDSQVKIPSDAPKLAKAGLGALSGLTPTGRAWVLGVLGLAAIIAAAILIAMRVLHV